MLQGSPNPNKQKIQISLSPKVADSSTETNVTVDGNTIDVTSFSKQLLRGAKFEAANDLERAIDCYMHAVKLNPRSIKANQTLAKALNKNGRISEAKLYNNLAKKLKFSSANDVRESTASLNQNKSSQQKIIGSVQKQKISLNLQAKNAIASSSNSQDDSRERAVAKAGVILPSTSELYLKNYLQRPELRVGDAYLEQAKAYFEEGKWHQAIAACQSALSNADLALAYKIWGNCLQKQGQTSEAFGLYAKALEINPEFAEVYANMGSLLAMRKRWHEAIKYFQQALNINPRMASVHRNLAKTWEAVGDDDLAEESLLKALELEPDTLSAKQYFKLGADFTEKNKQQQAIACYRLAVRAKPDYAAAYLKLIALLEAQSRWQEANRCYRQLLTISDKSGKKTEVKSQQRIRSLLAPAKNNASLLPALPQSAEPRIIVGSTAEIVGAEKLLPEAMSFAAKPAEVEFKRGKVAAAKKKWREAISCFRRAIELDPKSIPAYWSLAEAYGNIDEYEIVSDIVYKIYELKSDTPSAQNYYQLGNMLQQQGKNKRANICYRRASILDPGFAAAREKLSQGIATVESAQQGQKVRSSITVEKKTPSEAKTLVIDGRKARNKSSKSLVGQKDSAVAQNTIVKINELIKQGKIAEGKKDWQSAAQYYRQAIALNPQNWQCLYQLAEVLSKQENWSEAALFYSQAIKLHGNFSWSFNNLGYALIQLERWSDAVKVYRRAIELNPPFPWAYYNLAEAYDKLGQWDRVVPLLQKTIQLDSKLLPQVLPKLADARYRRSDRDRQEALRSYQQAIEQTPDNIDLYHQALAIDSKNIDLYLKLGNVLVKSGKLEQALVTYQMAGQIQPQHLDVLAHIQEAQALLRQASEPALSLDALGRIVNLSSLPKNEANQTTLKLSTSDFPIVSIVIPVYNQIQYTLKCLQSIANNISVDIAIEVIVVNDCSTDETVAILKQVEGLHRIDNLENEGFLHSCNHGAARAKGEFIYFLNNDTELRPHALETLIEVFQQDETVGAVGSKLLYPDGSLQEAGGIIWQDGSGWNYGRKDNPLAPQYNFLRAVDYCSAASLLVRKSTLVALNAFDRRFTPAYYEDTDLCFAIRHVLGLKVMYQPKSEVVHHEGVSCGNDLSNGIKSFQSVNMNKFAAKWAKELTEYPSNQNDISVAAASRRHSGKKTIVVIDLYAPCYDKESGSRRIWELIQIFRKLNYYVIFVPDNGVKEEPYVEMLQAKGIEVVYTQLGHGIAIEQQLEVLLPLVDIAWVCRPQLYEKYAPLIRQWDSIKLIYDTVDLHYLRLQRAGQFSDFGNSIESMREWVRMQSKELKAAHEADLTITITDTEQEILQQQQVSNLAVVPNIHSPYMGNKLDFAARKGLLFIGSYNHPPNTDAVNWLVREIMPLVWQENPELIVTLLGNNPSEEIIALGEDSRIIVTGYVSDVTPYFINNRVFIAPLRYGAGMKGKICQSLEYGLPIVSTTIGIEGMNLIPEENVLQADLSGQFAKQIVRLYKDEVLWNRLANNSHNAIAFLTPETAEQNLHGLLNNLVKKITISI